MIRYIALLALCIICLRVNAQDIYVCSDYVEVRTDTVSAISEEASSDNAALLYSPRIGLSKSRLKNKSITYSIDFKIICSDNYWKFDKQGEALLRLSDSTIVKVKRDKMPERTSKDQFTVKGEKIKLYRSSASFTVSGKNIKDIIRKGIIKIRIPGENSTFKDICIPEERAEELRLKLLTLKEDLDKAFNTKTNYEKDHQYGF